MTRRGRVQRFVTRRFTGGRLEAAPDDVVVEEPLSIQLDGVLVSTTMRTPGDDFELAVGFCFTEGLLAGVRPTSVRYCATGPASETAYNVATVDTGGLAPPPTPRLGPATSSCGICGSESIDGLVARLAPLSSEPFDVAWLAAVPALVSGTQELFAVTGGAHAAAAVDRDGTVAAVREDIGRHNAVDKVVGRLLLDDRLPVTDAALYVSGRASFELVAKAWAAGFGALVSVSAPSALAVETARRAGIQLAGFARDGRCNLYAPSP